MSRNNRFEINYHPLTFNIEQQRRSTLACVYNVEESFLNRRLDRITRITERFAFSYPGKVAISFQESFLSRTEEVTSFQERNEQVTVQCDKDKATGFTYREESSFSYPSDTVIHLLTIETM